MTAIKIATPQALLILGDVAATSGYGAFSLGFKPIFIEFNKITGKNSFLHLNYLNLHVEFNQLTPIIPPKTPFLAKKIINLTHALLLEFQPNYGIDIKIEASDFISTPTVLASLLVSLIKGVVLINKTFLTSEQILEFCKTILEKSALEIPFYMLVQAIYPNFVYSNGIKQTIKTFNSVDIYLAYIPISQPNLIKIQRKTLKHIRDNGNRYQFNLDMLGKLAELGSKTAANGNITKLGEYLNRTHKLLSDFGIISDNMHKLCIQAMLSGALGAKYSTELSGILILCDQKGIEVKSNLMKQGYKIIDILTS